MGGCAGASVVGKIKAEMSRWPPYGARNLNWRGRRIRKAPPWPDCPTRYGNRAPTPRSKRKREARFLIKPQDKARLAAHLVLAVLLNALPQQGCANIICRHQKTAYKQSKVNRKRYQAALSCPLALRGTKPALSLYSVLPKSAWCFRAMELGQSQG